MMTKITNWLIASIVIIFTTVPFYNMIIKGVYSWHIQQPEFWQGGIEVLGFVVATWALVIFSKNNKVLWLVFFGVIYLSMNGVIVPALTVLIYFEALNLIGGIGNKNEHLERTYISENLILGIGIWTFFAIILSLIGHGTFNSLRWLTVALSVATLLINRGKGISPLTVSFYKFYKPSQNKTNELLMVIVVFFILALMAKTNTAQDYDSLWYGLRPELVLVGSNSFYDYLGMVAHVYYYPKLMELLFLPISNLGDYSFIIIGNIFVYIIFLTLFSQVARENLKKASKNFILSFTLIIFSIPAVANIAVTAKPDFIGAFFTFCAFVFFAKFIACGETRYVVIALISFMFITGAKLTYLFWGGLLFLCCVIFLIYFVIKKKPLLITHKKKDVIVVLMSALAMVGVHYRTYKLTGYPLYPLLFDKFQKIGFRPIYPARVEPDPLFSESHWSFMRLYEFIFDPNNLPHIIMLWTSTITIVLVIIFIIIGMKSIRVSGFDSSDMFYIIVAFVLGIMTIFYIFNPPNPDGNYYILPIIIISFILMKYINKAYEQKVNFVSKHTIILSVSVYLCLHLVISFVSNPSWAIGTKPFSKELIINNFETETRNEEMFRDAGINKIAHYVDENYSRSRIISSNDNDAILYRINAPIETYQELTPPRAIPEIMGTYEGFLNYVVHANIKAFILLDEDESVLKDYVSRLISEEKCSKIIEDEKASFYALSEEETETTEIKRLGIELIKGYIYDDGWISKEITVRTESKSGNLNLEMYFTDELLPNEIEVFINGKLEIHSEIKDNSIQISKKINIIDKPVNIRIKLKNSIVPKEVGLNDDERELAAMLQKIRFK